MHGPEQHFNIGLMWRGDPDASLPAPQETRHALIFAAFEALDVAATPIVYSDRAVERIRAQLLRLDAVLVWVNPLSDEGDRSLLDPMLRDVAAAGVAVSTHPDVILKMGTKEVLVTTRSLGWGTDTRLYGELAEFRQQFPEQLGQGPRVLKQLRGNDGVGVWRVRRLDGDLAEVLHAQRGSLPETLPLAEFMRRCEGYFDKGGGIVDQPFQARLADGMIRCYVAGTRVVGFGQQKVTALLSPETPPPRTYHPPTLPHLQPLRRLMESEWIPGLQRLLAIEEGDLPALWDADFLFGPKDQARRDTYVLCEINVSSVAPYPETAAEPVARLAKARARAARALRSTVKARDLGEQPLHGANC
jgi:hypothetical protein